jgi:hypothetical protein
MSAKKQLTEHLSSSKKMRGSEYGKENAGLDNLSGIKVNLMEQFESIDKKDKAIDTTEKAAQ